MAINLKNLRRVKASEPPRILIYGPEKEGKTTLASEFPNAVFLQTEIGTPGDKELDVIRAEDGGPIDSFSLLMDSITELYQEDHGFQTIVVDTIDRLEVLITAQACRDNNWKSIEDPGYGKGYVILEGYWRDFLAGLNALRNERGMTTILIGHSEIGRFDDPNTMSYSKYDIRLHKKAAAIIKSEVDAILLVNKEVTIKTEEQGFNKKRVHGEGGMQRWIFTEARPSFVSGNRYSMPDKILFTKGGGYAALAPYLPTHRVEPATAASAQAA